MKSQLYRIINELKNPRSGWQTTLLIGLIALFYVRRSLEYIRHAQLYGDDGPNWLEAGYNHGLSIIFTPVNGFLHVPERLFGVIVAQLPLQYVPLIFNFSALVIFLLFVYYLISPRAKILTNNYERVAVTLSLCLIANIDEFFFNFSNTMFLIGIIGVILITIKKPKNLYTAAAEKILFISTCFTLPLAWFYVPILLFDRFKYKQKNNLYLLVAIFAALAQIVAFLTSHVNRSAVSIQTLFSVHGLLEVQNQIITPAIRFARIDIPTFTQANHLAIYGIMTVLLSTFALFLGALLVLKNSKKQVWYLLFLLTGMTLASLKSPLLQGESVAIVQFLSTIGGGDRYFIYGIIAVSLIFAKVTYRIIVPQFRWIFLGIFFGFGLISSLQYGSFYINKGFTDYRSEYSRQINLLQSGTVRQVEIPINPNNDDHWKIKLKRKQ